MRQLCYLLVVALSISNPVWAQLPAVNIAAYPQTLSVPLDENYTPGTFFVPKTTPAFNDFMTNGIHQSAIRSNVIESALNNATNLTQCLSLLQSVQSDLVSLSQKCDRLIFIFEKMPAWLSSSSNGSPAQTPGWYVLNTKPPASWNAWQTAVDSITSTIVNQFGINNAWFEVWNEPDLGSWTGTMNEYWMLYKTTYDGVKSASSSARVGGPAVNGWANGIGWQPPYGHVWDNVADSSVIGQLLDSSVVWNRVPDFISWHSFDMNQYALANAAYYISNKLNALSLPAIPCFVSEWNASSAVRELPWAAAYCAMFPSFVTYLPNVQCNMVAAWQDFNQSATEFHQDYGLLTYGAIHKPAYYATLLNEKMSGTRCAFSCTDMYTSLHVTTSVTTDTVFLMITNYSPLPVFEALNFTLSNAGANVNDLDYLGYIDLASGDLSHLDSMYRNLIPVTGSSVIDQTIIAARPYYQYYDSVSWGPRQFGIGINGFSGNCVADIFIIDSTHNNMKFRYDSLIAAGYTQSNAIAYVTATQALTSYRDTLVGGYGSVYLEPNAICLVRMVVPGVSTIEEQQPKSFAVWPNPFADAINVSWTDEAFSKRFRLTDVSGRVVMETVLCNNQQLHFDELSDGIYFLSESDKPFTVQKITKRGNK